MALSPLTIQPYDYIGDSTGRPLDKGMVYIGVAGLDPEFNQIPVFLDEAMTLLIDQPIRTNDGFVEFAGDLRELYASADVYSLKVLDKQGRKVIYKAEMMRDNLTDDALSSLNAAIIEAQAQAVITTTEVVTETIDSIMIGDYQAQLEIDVDQLSDDVASQKLDTGITATSKNGTLPIDQSVKNAQTVSAVEYGATGDGATDDTAAFNLLESNITGRIIDLQGKTYVTQFEPMRNKYINGFFKIAGVVHSSEFKPNELQFKKHCMNFVTGDRHNESTNPLIFGGSDNTFQSFCIIPQASGNPKFYVTQRSYRPDASDTGNWLKGETYRIVEYEFKEDNSNVTVTQFSEPLAIGHGSDLGYAYDNEGQLWFYSGYPSDSNTDSLRSDKGFSRIRWRGAATNDADITYYQLFDYPEIVNGIYPHLLRGAVTVSPDGQLLAIQAQNTLTGEQNRLTYSLPALITATVPKNVKPLSVVIINNELSVVEQGIALHDNKTVSYYDIDHNRSAIRISDINGTKLSYFEFDTFQSYYTRLQLRGAKGVLRTAEGEGVYVYANDIYVGYRDYWVAIGDTVSYNGKYYAPRKTNTNTLPTDSDTWQEIDAAYAVSATAWSASTAYTVTDDDRTEVNKRIYKISSVPDAASVAIGYTNAVPTDYNIERIGVRYGAMTEYTTGDIVKREYVYNNYGTKTLYSTTSKYGEVVVMSNSGASQPFTISSSGTMDVLTLARYDKKFISFYASGSNAVFAARNAYNLYIGTYTTDAGSGDTGAHTRLVFSGSGDKIVEPASNADVSLGKADRIFKDIYLGAAPIVSSDERLKQDFRKLKAAEKKAALEIKTSICLYKMRESVTEKGDGARWHVGVKAQEIVAIMESHKLKPFDYGFICHDTWVAQDAELDDDGNEVQVAREAGDKYAVRYDELAMFILAAI